MKEEMKKGQDELKKKIEKGLDELKERMKKGQDDLKNSFEEKINIVNKQIAGRVNKKIEEVQTEIFGVKTKDSKVEEKLQNEVTCAKQEMKKKMERKIGVEEENFSLVSLKVQELDNKL